MHVPIFFALASFTINLPKIDSAKILIFVPGISNSQLIFNYRLGDLLASKGHHVTLYVAKYYSNIDLTKTPKHASVLRYEAATTEFDELKKTMDDKLFEDQNPVKAIPMFLTWISLFKNGCEKQISDEELMRKLKNEKFDVAMGHMYDLCPLGMFRALNITSTIWMSSGILLDYMAWYAGVPSPASFVPNAMSSFGDVMSLAERFKNLLGVSIFHIAYRYIMVNPYRDLFRKHYGPDFPDVTELAAKVPLIFVNSEELIDFPRPILHKVIYIGGIDANQPEPLTDEWQRVMDNSKKGVILFSFGSVANSAKMPAHWKAAFLEAFSRFPDYSFVWKFDGPFPEAAKVKNLKITKWAPQKDMLAHSKLKAFITHGGFNSFLEAANNGVPLLILPIFGDQMGNAKRAQRNGIAAVLKKSDLTPDSVYEGLKEVLTNPNYTINAKRVSSMLKKKPVKADQLAVGWVEFLAEHKELPNLQPVSAELGLLEYFLIDVMLILLLGASVIVFVMWVICKCVVYRCCGKKGSRKRTKSKRE